MVSKLYYTLYKKGYKKLATSVYKVLAEDDLNNVLTKHVNNKKLSNSEEKQLIGAIKNSRSSKKEIQRVARDDPGYVETDFITFKEPTPFTGIDLLSGKSAGQIGIKYNDEALFIIKNPKRGLDIDYKKINTVFNLEDETVIAGNYRVVKKYEVEHPASSGELVVYVLG